MEAEGGESKAGEANARREQDLEAEVGQVESLAEHLLRFCPLPGLPGGRGGDGDVDLSCHPPVHGPEGDLKGVRGDADFNVSLPGPELEPQGTAKQPREEKQRIVWDNSLSAEAAVQGVASRLLKQKLQVLLRLHGRHLARPQEMLQEERHCLELERRLPAACGDPASAQHTRSLYREMAKHLEAPGPGDGGQRLLPSEGDPLPGDKGPGELDGSRADGKEAPGAQERKRRPQAGAGR